MEHTRPDARQRPATAASRYEKPRHGGRLLRRSGLWRLTGNNLFPGINLRYWRFHRLARRAFAVAGTPQPPPSAEARELREAGLCHAGAGLPRTTALALSARLTALIEAGAPQIEQLHRGTSRLNNPLDAFGAGCLDFFDGATGAILRQHYGSHFRIEWVDCYRTDAGAERKTSWLWHIDNVPPGALKVMLLLTDSTRATGAMRYLPRATTRALRRAGYFGIQLKERTLDLDRFGRRAGVKIEPRWREAPAGDTLIFDPNILHCGEPPERGFRDVMTFFMVPSLLPWRDALAKTGTARVQSEPGGFPATPAI